MDVLGLRDRPSLWMWWGHVTELKFCGCAWVTWQTYKFVDMVGSCDRPTILWMSWGHVTDLQVCGDGGVM